MAIMIEAIFESMFELTSRYVWRLFRRLFGTFFFYTGELTFCIMTLGRHKLQPNPYHNRANPAAVTKSLALGGLVWLVLTIGALAIYF